MSAFSNKTLAAISGLSEGVDGCYGIMVKHQSEHTPKGITQDCDTGHVKSEWVSQSAGFSGDDFTGTVTWKLGEYYVIAMFAC
ncbi:MAG: hypothetical protein JKY32_07160 [Rhizobiales bacterium]|nr:hypothetical protein [Hyphomicrobiales bacterium]